jgi:hypothetical protein
MLERDVVRAARQQLAEQGLHWMLTPSQPLTLVHAVESLEPPLIDIAARGGPSVRRRDVVLAGKIKNHAKNFRQARRGRAGRSRSTTRRRTPSTLDGQAHVGDFQLGPRKPITRKGRNDVASPPTHKLRHEFGDTKHRRRYHAVATTRFREYFRR